MVPIQRSHAVASTKKQPKSAIPYATSSVHAMEEKRRTNLHERSGKSYDGWRNLMLKACTGANKERIAWLKKQGLTLMCATAWRWVRM